MENQKFRQMNYLPLHLSDCIISNKLSAKNATALLIFDDPAYNFKAVRPKPTDLDQIDWWTQSQQGLSQWISTDATIIAVAPVIYPDPVVFLKKAQERA
ncbi:MAG: hypothetical protein LBK23_11810 [Oscillospiraceae bacterium]|jgi:hypothetical protein|nr:hypothetical protein [Oscillospiraceae bacterium]